MSGHSKWNNIKRKKEKTDAAKAKIFTKIGKEMAVAIRAGGPNPDNNSKLRELIAKAKANNVPNDNIDRAIKKFRDSDVVYEEITYEGYGPGGVAVIVKAATDNRNRTAGEVRHYFDKCGGNMGVTGCVSFLVTEMGLITIVDEDGEVDEEKLMEVALEAGLGPPSRMATAISLPILVKTLARAASVLPFLRLMLFHFECPDISISPIYCNQIFSGVCIQISLSAVPRVVLVAAVSAILLSRSAASSQFTILQL